MIETPCSFDSQGSTCSATLYRPDGLARPPVLLMAHGFGAVRAAGLPDYARHFVESTSWSVLLFDYRGFGDSGGRDRQLIGVWRQLDDWRAAIAFARRLPDVDGQRLALWGYSFSGGHVIRLAGETEGLLGILAMAPHLSGLAGLAQVTPLTLLRLSAAGIADLLGGLVGRPVFVQTIGRAGETAALASDDAWAAYQALRVAGVDMDNRVRARIALALPYYSPLRDARRVQVPALVMAGDVDPVTPARLARKAAERMPDARYVEYHGLHFDPMFPPLREQIWDEQTAFLRRLANPLQSQT